MSQKQKNQGEANQEEAKKPPRRAVEKTRHPEFTTIYVNSSQVQIGTFDVRLSLGNLPEDDKDDDVIRMEERVLALMSPQHAKALARLLVANIKRYEDEFGPINLTPKSDPTSSPLVETE
jgi:hypothetical protein